MGALAFQPGEQVTAVIHNNAEGKSRTISGTVADVHDFQGRPGAIVYISSPQSTHHDQPELAWATNTRHGELGPASDGQLF